MSTTPNGLSQVRYILAVASGKGGVGKSTTAVNLALALQAQGWKTGLLDADIYGPSVPLMVGVPAGTKPEVIDGNAFAPVQGLGLATMSLGYLLAEKAPAVWRGPMATGALQQMLGQTQWGELDCLVIDMPPGTGDIQLTLAQNVPVSGAVVVTTPQDIALLDAQKGVEMFRKVSIPVLGVVENMAMHTCSQCGHSEHIFGEGGGERIAREYQTELLGALPLDRSIREQVDGGNPTVAADPSGAIARIYSEIASKVMAGLESGGAVAPEIEIE